jgi:hypothetical protein
MPASIRAFSSRASFSTMIALLIFLVTAGAEGRFGKAPEFPSQDPKRWIGPPQNWKALEGKVVILDVWTFG